ncbi:hypothetical protein N9L47_02205 [Rhodobacteraceae bacterium]|nr:hypothetical protein [Paracoccaceae bacterium]
MTTTAKDSDRLSTKELKNSAEALAQDAKVKVEESLESVQETLDRASLQARQEIRKVSEQTTSFVRENPGVAVAGAVGIGVLIGLAMRQRY